MNVDNNFCPKCKGPASYEKPEIVDIGIGEIPCSSPSWECDRCGRVWFDEQGAIQSEMDDPGEEERRYIASESLNDLLKKIGS